MPAHSLSPEENSTASDDAHLTKESNFPSN
jgi:hypothetical protein